MPQFNVDILTALGEIVQASPDHTSRDFIRNQKEIRHAAVSERNVDKTLLWMARPSGVYCFRERDVFLEGTRQYNTWRSYGEGSKDKALACAIEVTGLENGVIRGNLYGLDYPQHLRHVLETALPVTAIRLFYEHGQRDIPQNQWFDKGVDPVLEKILRYDIQPYRIPESPWFVENTDPVLGEFLGYEFQPQNESALQKLLQQERENRRLEGFRNGSCCSESETSD